MISKLKWGLTLATTFVGFILLTQFYPDFLWFQSFNLTAVWIKEIQSKVAVFGIGFAVALVWFLLHLILANRNCRRNSSLSGNKVQTGIAFIDQFFSQLQSNVANSQFSQLSRRAYSVLKLIAIFGLSVFFGFLAKGNWEAIILFLNQSSFGQLDPIFNRDISFYLFSVPFFNALHGWVVSLLTFSLVAVFWLYLSENLVPALFTRQKIGKGVQCHVLFLLGTLLILMGVGIWLNRFDMMLSSHGVVHGMGYTDHHIKLPVMTFSAVLYMIVGVLVWLWPILPVKMLPVYVGGLILAFQLIVGAFLPGLIQSYIVQPNEIVKEKPYIKHNIELTRQAYGLNVITDEQFPVSNTLTLSDIQSESLTMSNIRLWNREPLKQTFSQLQEIRLYYEFGNIDVDRYMINGQLQQVMLSPRELDASQLTSQAQTWTNRHLVYTHGYGVCMSPVNEVTTEGLPKFYIKDLPPVSTHISITRPEIYFGEKTNDYVVVNTKQQEFDYPKGDKNVYTNYQGQGGIQLNSALKRLVYALRFSDMKLLVSSLFTKESRLLYDRTITTIVRKITPFIALDSDPYLITLDNGRLVWMLDGYTFSSNFPYSEPYYRRVNYLRNAVKVTVDAYDGSVQYYITDPNEPIIKAYSKFYTGLFKPMTEMPDSLLAHIRYPKDLFSVQAHMYRTYHMTDPQVFYNREDLWAIPNETYEQSEQPMQPYYMVTKLPGDSHENFLTMLPFTPTNKNNMIAWMSAKCDPNEYGQIKVYKFPKERTIYGPMQIESRIDQDTEISQKLTLWGQVGSRVIRGNLMVIPVRDSLVYVEPIYLQATQSKLPELKRVIVAYGDKIVMSPTLDEAVQSVFDHTEVRQEPSSSLPKSNASNAEVSKGRLKALYHSFKSEKGINWDAFTELMKGIESYLK